MFYQHTSHCTYFLQCYHEHACQNFPRLSPPQLSRQVNFPDGEKGRSWQHPANETSYYLSTPPFEQRKLHLFSWLRSLRRTTVFAGDGEKPGVGRVADDVVWPLLLLR